MFLILAVVVALAAGQASFCGTSRATGQVTVCDLNNNPCATCFPTGVAGASMCSVTQDATTGTVTLVTRLFQNYSNPVTTPAGNTWTYPPGVVLVFQDGFKSGPGVTLSFCLPSARTFTPSGTASAVVPAPTAFGLMTATTNQAFSMGGNIVLRTGSVVPSNAFNIVATNAGTPFIGIFGTVSTISYPDYSDPCFTVQARATYSGSAGTSASLSTTISQIQNVIPGCVPVVSSGLSGGAIAGIVIGSIAGAVLLALLAVFLFKKLDFDSKRQLFSRTKIHAAESSVPM